MEHAAREEAARECVTEDFIEERAEGDAEKLAVTNGEWWKLLEWKVRATSRTGLLDKLWLCDGEADNSE